MLVLLTLVNHSEREISEKGAYPVIGGMLNFQFKLKY